MPHSKRIKATLIAKGAIDRATKFHNSLLVKFLKTLNECHNNENDAEVTKQFDTLEKEWFEFCDIHGYQKEAKPVFALQIRRILDQLKAMPPTKVLTINESVITPEA